MEWNLKQRDILPCLPAGGKKCFFARDALTGTLRTEARDALTGALRTEAPLLRGRGGCKVCSDAVRRWVKSSESGTEEKAGGRSSHPSFPLLPRDALTGALRTVARDALTGTLRTVARDALTGALRTEARDALTGALRTEARDALTGALRTVAPLLRGRGGCKVCSDAVRRWVKSSESGTEEKAGGRSSHPSFPLLPRDALTGTLRTVAPLLRGRKGRALRRPLTTDPSDHGKPPKLAPKLPFGTSDQPPATSDSNP
jgi:hypothetical protein